MRPRVCHIASGDVWGGLEAVVLSLLRAQQAAGAWAPALIVLNDGRLAGEARQLGIEVLVVDEAARGFRTLLGDVGNALARLRPQVVHTHRYKENLLSFLLARRYGARCVVTVHGFEPPAGRLARLKLELRERMLHRLGRIAGARSVAVSEELRRRHRADVVVPNGIALRPPATRAAVDGAPVTLGWIGRLVPVKGLDTLLDAFALLAAGRTSRETPLELLLVGGGPEREALASHAETLGIGDRVRFAGEVADIAPWLARMDAFVFPSLREGVPIALLEAMGAGVPVVVAAVGGIPDVIGPTDTGILVASRDPQVWAAAIRRTLEDPGAAAARGGRARERVRTHFSLDAMASAYASIYSGR